MGWRNCPPPELDWMDLDIDLSLTRMEELVGGVLISPSKSKVHISPANSKVKHLPDSQVEVTAALSQYQGYWANQYQYQYQGYCAN